MLTIALIDKFPILRSGAEILFKDHLKDFCLLTAPDVASFQMQYPGKKPDVVVIGIFSEKLADPFELVPVIKSIFSCPVVIYNDLPSDNLCIRYFSAGAHGYISKCDPCSEFLACIRAVSQDRYYAASNAFQFIINYSKASKSSPKTPLFGLTRRQYEIATYLSLGMGTSAIAKNLQRKMSTISTTKKQIYKKLNINSIMKLHEIINERAQFDTSSIVMLRLISNQ